MDCFGGEVWDGDSEVGGLNDIDIPATLPGILVVVDGPGMTSLYYSGCVGSIHFTVSGFSTGSRSGKFTATASESLLMSTHSSFSSAEALIS